MAVSPVRAALTAEAGSPWSTLSAAHASRASRESQGALVLDDGLEEAAGACAVVLLCWSCSRPARADQVGRVRALSRA